MITGVGGRLAFGANGLLFSTAKSAFGGADPLNGIHVATLATMTLIKSAPAVVVDIEGKSVEPQPIRYRALFPREDVETSEIEITDNGVLVQRLPASLDEEGEGEVGLPVGTKHSPLKARLIINRDQPATQRPSLAVEKPLRAVAFEIEPASAETLEVGVDELEVAAVNKALIERLAKDPASPMPLLRWEGPGVLNPPSPPGGLPSTTGIYSTELIALAAAGTTGKVRLMKDTTVLAETGPLTITSGPAFFTSGQMRVVGAPQDPQTSAWLVPADGTTRVTVIVEGVRDAAGNTVADGTPVAWSVEGEDGELLNAGDAVLVGGRAEVQYQAGVEAGDVVVRATAGTTDLPMNRFVTIRQTELEVTLSNTWPTVSVTVSSAAGPPSNGTPVFWLTNRGSITGQGILTDGRALAAWSAEGIPERPAVPVSRWASVIAIVGRTRASLRQDTHQPVSGLTNILLNRDRIVVDVPAGQNLAGTPFQEEATATVEGEPGATLRLVLGSTRFPVVEPVAAFALDRVEEGLASDLYGGAGAVVAPGVVADDSEPTHQPAALHFDGSGGLTLSEGLAVQLVEDFDFNLWVRFDATTVGQNVVEKAGSYVLELIDEGNGPRLAFSVLSGGVSRRVVSHQVVTAESWYQVAAHVRNGRLALSVGADDRVDLGDSVTSVDPSPSSVEFGGTLMGHLDDIAVYDFSRLPFVAFEDGSTERDVTLDAAGSAQVRIVSGATFATGLRAQLATAPPAGAFTDRLHAIPVRTYTAPAPTQPSQVPEPFNLTSYMKGIFGQAAQECVDGIASGESEDFAGVGCDLSIGLVAGTAQSVRDAFVVARNYTRGKRSVGDYIKGAFAVVALVAVAVPGARTLKNVLVRARAEVTGARVEARLAREALAKVSRIVEEGASESESVAARILGREGASAEAKEAVFRLLGVCAGVRAVDCSVPLSTEAFAALDDLAKRYGDDIGQEAFVKGVGKAYVRLGNEGTERLLRGLRQIPHPVRLTDEAIEGLGVFFKHARGERRLMSVWEELTLPAYHGLPPAQAEQALEAMLRKLRVADDKLFQVILSVPDAAKKEALQRWWHNFIARGAGTSRRARSTAGFS
jgi:hypothetical protein